MATEHKQRSLGTFIGVFTPTILTILGVIMYLRFGWLVGQLGLLKVLIVVAVANTITLVTTLSFSSVATNARIGAGGAYFIISRSLGVSLGGAIGFPLFLSQAFSVTLYSYGLAESFRILAPNLPLLPVTLGVILMVGLLAVSGADRALKSQVILMAFVGISLVALAIGAWVKSGGVLPGQTDIPGDLGFWAGFAIFFPAVTGVMAGLGLSGDLRDPAKALPLGSIVAVLLGFAIYMTIPFLLMLGAPLEALREDTLIWTRIAWAGPWLILPGLWAAIFSSAVGSILAAPRTLQALARDGLAPRIFWRPTGDWKELLPGFLMAVAIALLAALLGNLNKVATVVSMFFLTVYGTVNLVAAFEVLSGDPSWRPKIRVPWPVSLLGGIACLAVMVLISPLAGLVAIAAEVALYTALSRRARKARWGDARRGLYETLIRWSLLRLSRTPLSARNWRPHMLIFVDDPVRELDLVQFGNWFSQGRGVVTACNLVVGKVDEHGDDITRRRDEMQEYLDRQHLAVFAQVDVVGSVVEGIVDVAQASGLAGMSSNTILLGWPDDPGYRQEFLRVMRRLEHLRKSLVVGRIKPKHLFNREDKRKIHVWWGGLERNGDLMLLLAHLLRANHEWRDAGIELISIASNEAVKARTEAMLAKLIPDLRIEATARIILKTQEQTVAELIQRESADADVVFLGLSTPAKGDEAAYAERMESLAGDLPVVFYVKNATLFIGDLLDSPVEEFDESGGNPAPESRLPKDPSDKRVKNGNGGRA